MPRNQTKPDKLLLRYRPADNATGVSRKTAQRLAAHFGVDETHVVHLALREYAQKHLPRYAPDDGPLSAAQLRQIRARFPQGTRRSVSSTLFKEPD